MFVPIIMALATVALWVVCCLCMIWLVSAAPFVSNGDIFTSIVDFRDLSLIRFYYFVFGTLWCNALLQAVTTFVIASACCMWYYSHGPSGDLHLPVKKFWKINKISFRIFGIWIITFGYCSVYSICFLNY
jgi:solute carrier family 44 protein 1 (choline transporter-like protein)/choline transporter-like protein 2/4/5